MAVNYDELELTVTRAQSGDVDAIQRLYTDTFPTLYSISLDLMGNTHEAEDMVQEAFHLIFLNLEKIPERRYFIPWAKRITTNYCYRYLRRTLDLPMDIFEMYQGIAASSEEDPVNLVIHAERDARLSQLLSSMDPILRRTMELKFYEDKKVQEIAEIMDCPVGTVKSRLHKARKVLRELIEKDKPFLAMLAPVLPLSVVVNKTTAQASGVIGSSIGHTGGVATVGGIGSTTAATSASVFSTPAIVLGTTVAVAVGGAVIHNHMSTETPVVDTYVGTDSEVEPEHVTSTSSNIEFLNCVVDGDKASILVGEAVNIIDSTTPGSGNNSSDVATDTGELDSTATPNTSYRITNIDFGSIHATTEDGYTVMPTSVDTSTGVVIFDKITEDITVSVRDYNGATIKSRIYIESEEL